MKELIDQAPGVYGDVPDETYRRWRGAPQSLLKILKENSPSHALFQAIYRRKATETLKRGSALHTKVLQPELFESRWLVNQDRKTCPDDDVTLGSTVYDQVCGMAKSILAHPVAAELLADNGARELSLVWDDCESGVRCKARLDQACAKRRLILDVKTAEDVSPGRFSKEIYNWGYHIQGAHYLQGAAACGLKAEHFVLIAVEAKAAIVRDGKPAHAVAVYVLDAEAIDTGARELSELLAQWKECEASGIWPGYREAVVELGLPAWAVKKGNDDER